MQFNRAMKVATSIGFMSVLTGCYTWSQPVPGVQHTVEGAVESGGQVRLMLYDGQTVAISDPILRADSLVEQSTLVGSELRAIALRDIKTIQRRKLDAANTFLSAVAIGAVGFVALLAYGFRHSE